MKDKVEDGLYNIFIVDSVDKSIMEVVYKP